MFTYKEAINPDWGDITVPFGCSPVLLSGEVDTPKIIFEGGIHFLPSFANTLKIAQPATCLSSKCVVSLAVVKNGYQIVPCSLE